jgi:hypothetical protein
MKSTFSNQPISMSFWRVHPPASPRTKVTLPSKGAIACERRFCIPTEQAAVVITVQAAVRPGRDREGAGLRGLFSTRRSAVDRPLISLMFQLSQESEG